MFEFLNKMLNRTPNKVKTPTIIQMEAVECGAASLAMILAYYGRWIPLEKLRQECGVNRDGSKASRVVKAAIANGCEAGGYAYSTDDILEKKPYPSIIHWEFNHFVVLEGIQGDKAYINDPGVGHRIIDIADFRTSYTGITLKIKPGENFQKYGHSYSVVKDLARKLTQDKWAALFIFIIEMLMIVPGLASPVFGQIFLDEILPGKHEEWMPSLVMAMVVAFVIQGSISFLRSWVLTKWQEKLTIADSSRFFWHLLKLPMQFFQQRFASETASRVGMNEAIASVLSNSGATVILDFFVALFYLFLLFQYSVSLTLIGIFFSLVNLGVFFYLRRRIIEKTMKIQQDAGKAYGIAMNGLSMIESLKANGDESDFFAKWAGWHTKVAMSSQEVALLQQSVTMLPVLLGGVNGALIMTIGSFSIMDGVMTAGIFMSFQALMGNFQAPFNSIVGLAQTLQTTEMQMQRLNDVYRYEPDELNFPKNPPKSFDKPRLSGKLEIKDMSFGYSPLEAPLLEHFSLKLEPGRWVAVVGPSGSGKSTLAKVVSGLYEQWSGDVLFDDVNRKEIPRNIIANSVSCVDQDIFQLSGTIRNNIALFNGAIRRSEIMQAAIDACIHDDILKLDGGYDAQVSEGGSNFSGGQRQRLEIARALAVNPSLLILDEATSALDPITEQRILTNIRRRGCACLIVAHRLSTIRDADEIIVLRYGKVVERGTHEELLNNNGFYSWLIKERSSEEAEGLD